MNIPKITIKNNWVYIDGIKSKKKYMIYYYHSRDIFYNDCYVIKLAISVDGYSSKGQNLQERQLWKSIEKDKFYRQYFSPSLYCHNKGLFLVQKRMRFTSHSRTIPVRNLVDKLAKEFGLEDVYSDSDKNWGMIGFMHPVIYDYGV